MAKERMGLRQLRALKSCETVWDATVPGFGARRQRSNAVAYVLKYRTAEGRQRWYTIGRHGAPWTPETARRKAKRILGEVVEGADPAAEKKAKRKARTVAELCDFYVTDAKAGRLLTQPNPQEIEHADNRPQQHAAPYQTAPRPRPEVADVSAPLLLPVVLRNPPDVKFTEAQFASLEITGNIRLSPAHRQDLENIGTIWVLESLQRNSARPKAFSKRLNAITTALGEAGEAITLHSETATPLERHLLNWAINAPVEGASTLHTQLKELEDQIHTVCQIVTRLQGTLPADPGRSRPHGDERMIRSLADIFEAAGGKPRVYASEHAEQKGLADTAQKGLAATAFRTFAHGFYELLPLNTKRPPGGFDEALRLAISVRRRAKKKGYLP